MNNLVECFYLVLEFEKVLELIELKHWVSHKEILEGLKKRIDSVKIFILGGPVNFSYFKDGYFPQPGTQLLRSQFEMRSLYPIEELMNQIFNFSVNNQRVSLLIILNSLILMQTQLQTNDEIGNSFQSLGEFRPNRLRGNLKFSQEPNISNFKIWMNPVYWFQSWEDYQVAVDQAIDKGEIKYPPITLETIVSSGSLRLFFFEKFLKDSFSKGGNVEL